MSFKREGDDKSQLNILKVTFCVVFSHLAFQEDTLTEFVMVSILAN